MINGKRIFENLPSNAYMTLGASINANYEELEDAATSKVLESQKIESQKEKDAFLKELYDACDVLLDPEKKSVYDKIFIGQLNKNNTLRHTLLSGKHQLAKELIKKGCQPSQGDFGENPIEDVLNNSKYDVSIQDKSACLKILVEYGVDSSNKFFSGHESLLNVAVQANDLEFVKMLLEKGTNINSRRSYEKPPAYYAIKNSNPKMLEFLISQKTELTHPDLLTLAIKVGNPAIIDILLKQKEIDVNQKDNLERYPAMYAVKKCHFEILNTLLKKGAKLDLSAPQYSDYYYRAFSQALAKKDVDLVGILIKADIDFSSFSIMSFAAEHNNLDLMRILHKKRSDLNGNKSDKVRPIHHAIKHKNIDMIKFLVKNGAKISDTNLLHDAIQNGDLTWARELVNHGANVNLIIEGKSPLDHAIKNENIPMIKFLIENGASPKGKNLSNLAIKVNDSDFTEFLIAKGIRIIKKDSTGKYTIDSNSLNNITATSTESTIQGSKPTSKDHVSIKNSEFIESVASTNKPKIEKNIDNTHNTNSEKDIANEDSSEFFTSKPR